MKNLLMLVLGVLFIYQAQAYNLDEVRDVLKIVESQNKPGLVGDNGRSWGILQIQADAIKDVNQRYGTQYIHQDAFEIGCAEEIFELYVSMWVEKLEVRHNRKATVEDIVRIWNGGPRGYQHKSTIKYLNKYYKYKTASTMNYRNCFIRGGSLGAIIATYTHTYDVYIFKSRKTINVNKKYIKLVPKIPTGDINQLTLKL